MLAFEASVDIDVKPPREHVEASSDPVPEHAEAFETHVKIEEEPVALAAVSEAPVEALDAAPGPVPAAPQEQIPVEAPVEALDAAPGSVPAAPQEQIPVEAPVEALNAAHGCLLYTSPSPRDS